MSLCDINKYNLEINVKTTNLNVREKCLGGSNGRHRKAPAYDRLLMAYFFPVQLAY